MGNFYYPDNPEVIQIYSLLVLAQDDNIRIKSILYPIVVDDPIYGRYQTAGVFIGDVLYVETIPPPKAEFVGQPSSHPDPHSAHGA